MLASRALTTMATNEMLKAMCDRMIVFSESDQAMVVNHISSITAMVTSGMITGRYIRASKVPRLSQRRYRSRAIAAAVPSTVATTVEIRATMSELRSDCINASLANIAWYHSSEKPPQVPTLRSAGEREEDQDGDRCVQEREHHPPVDGEQAVDPSTGGGALRGGHRVLPPLRK